MFPLPTVRMSSPRVSRTTQYPNGMAAGEVPGDDEGERLDGRYSQRESAYFDTQSFTVAQSRLSKNASM